MLPLPFPATLLSLPHSQPSLFLLYITQTPYLPFPGFLLPYLSTQQLYHSSLPSFSLNPLHNNSIYHVPTSRHSPLTLSSVPPLKVLPGLYVGNIRDSKDAEQLKTHNITHILSIHDNARKLPCNSVSKG